MHEAQPVKQDTAFPSAGSVPPVAPLLPHDERTGSPLASQAGDESCHLALLPRDGFPIGDDDNQHVLGEINNSLRGVAGECQ